VRVLALALVVAKIVAGRKTGFHGDFIHRRLLFVLCGNHPNLNSSAFRRAVYHPWTRTFPPPQRRRPIAGDPGYSRGPRRLLRAASRDSSLRRSTCSNRWLITPISAESSPKKKQEQRHGAPQRSIGRKSGLEARRDQGHARRNCREEHQRSGQNVEVARHKMRERRDAAEPDAILPIRSSASRKASRSPSQRPRPRQTQLPFLPPIRSGQLPGTHRAK